MTRLHQTQNTVAGGVVINLRCPYCRHLGTFTPYQNVNDLITGLNFLASDDSPRFAQVRSGIRVYPNRDCQALIFITAGDDAKLISYPPERIDFDSTQIPDKILKSLEEAITDHANHCFRSAAIMVRRTLEEICADRSATGKTLKDRIIALASRIIIPKELLEAADELRLLGNDAAHLEAQVYDDIGQEEIEVAIGLCKELLKAVYQLSSLVDRLRKLKNK